MNMNYMNRNNPMMQPNNQGTPNESFRNVFGVLGKSINLLIGGLQSLLHIFTSFIDILYFAKAFKSLIIDLLIMLLKKIYKILKYLLTFKWFVNFVRLMNSKYASIIYKSKNFKLYSICLRLFLIAAILICLILKYLKTEQLSQINKEDEDKDKEKEYNLSGNTNIDENNFINNNADSFNFIKKSQERWKEEI